MSEPGSQLSVVRNNDGWTFDGEIDAHSAPSLLAALSDFPDAPQIVADFSGVTFMDSSGLRVLVDASVRARNDGKTLVLANPQPAIKRVVEISGLSDQLNVVD
ncbi:hypothetical protein BH10ACT2_BH10ACT2_22220 [soil metagenome]